MIPKTIHYCWFGGGAKSDLIKRCMATWPQVMPDYEIREWNESNSPLDSRYVQRALDERAWAFLSDHVRTHALYTEGGIYLDTDVEVRKRFDPLLGDRCFFGFQLKQEQTDWIGTAVTGAVRQHPIIGMYRADILTSFDERREFSRSPTLLTALLKKMGLRRYGLQRVGDVTLYPIEYFYPYSWLGEFSATCVKDETYSIHHWAASWVKTPHQPPRRRSLLRRVARRLLRTR